MSLGWEDLSKTLRAGSKGSYGIDLGGETLSRAPPAPWAVSSSTVRPRLSIKAALELDTP